MTQPPLASDEDIEALPAGGKKCRTCSRYLTLAMFRVRPDRGNQPRQICRECETQSNLRRYHSGPAGKVNNRQASRKFNLKHNYGLTPDDFAALMAKQDGCCALCKEPAAKSRYGRLSVDHCHTTGKVRGLLCYKCNLGLGYFRDDPAMLGRAAAFLEAGGRSVPA